MEFVLRHGTAGLRQGWSDKAWASCDSALGAHTTGSVREVTALWARTRPCRGAYETRARTTEALCRARQRPSAAHDRGALPRTTEALYHARQRSSASHEKGALSPTKNPGTSDWARTRQGTVCATEELCRNRYFLS